MIPELPLNVVVVDNHTSDELYKFVSDQLSRWKLASDNFRALKKISTRTMEVNGLRVDVQFNPARAISSKARTDEAGLNSRPCFLCRSNRPAEQLFLDFEGTKGKKYHILTNPFPVFQNHLVIAADRHIPQSIWHRYVDLLILAKRYEGFTWIYNGPKCGASAPDHLHFQAFPSDILPLEKDVRAGHAMEYITCVQDASLYRYMHFAKGIFVIDGTTSKSVAKMLYRLLDCVPVPEGDTEPRFNLFTFHSEGHYISIVVLRTEHRSSHYTSADPSRHLYMSPGCVDVGGVLITVEREDYEKLTPELLGDMIGEVTISAETEDLILKRLTRTQPLMEVNIMASQEIVFEIISDGAGLRTARYQDGRIEYGGILYDELFFEAKTLSTMFADTSFILKNRKYAGSLRITVSDGKLLATNIIGIEDYLLSVMTAELSVSCEEPDFLEERTIAVRSALMSSLREESPQNYYGLTMPVDGNVRSAVDRTWGRISVNESQACDL
ncbi:MAG: DUF4922 domain-containing protein [Bacteroidales bacterium]|nr:DUF4922 domain-containing protein [Bacteroidales bacterium]